MSMNSEGRVTRPENTGAAKAPPTFTGNRGLMLEEQLIFERDDYGRTGVDLPEAPNVPSRLGGLERNRPIGLTSGWLAMSVATCSAISAGIEISKPSSPV